MAIVSRKMQYRKDLVLKMFKHPIQKVANVMDEGFTDEDFYSTFKTLYPELMDQAQEMYDDYRRHNWGRRKKGYKTIYFPEPDELLRRESERALRKIRTKHQLGNVLSPDVLDKNRQSLEKACAAKAEAYHEKKENYLKHAQMVCPRYVDTLISQYFGIRKVDALDINTRYLILLEIAQFYCEKSIVFLSKINASDKNIEMRHLAFDLLQQMGRHPWLARNRKGRKKQSMIKPIDIVKNPTALLDYIYKYQDTLHSRYDVFLSHSSYDVEELLHLKRILNSQGMIVYIDWVNDSVMMNRINQNEDTWNVLEKRMDESAKLLFVMTDNSLCSPWTKREVEYFKASGKPVCILDTGGLTEDKWEILNGLPLCSVVDNTLIES